MHPEITAMAAAEHVRDMRADAAKRVGPARGRRGTVARGEHGEAGECAVASGSVSQDGLVSPSATMTAGPVSRLAVAPGATASLLPGTSTVQGSPALPGHSPAAAAAAAAAA